MSTLWVQKGLTARGKVIWGPKDHPGLTDEWLVYRVHGACGKRPFYVGSTSDLPRRIGEHARRKDWWHEAKKIYVDYYPDRVAAEFKEGAAIRRYRPHYNIQANKPIPMIDKWTVEEAKRGWPPAITAIKWLFEQPPELRTANLGSLTPADFPNIDWS